MDDVIYGRSQINAVLSFLKQETEFALGHFTCERVTKEAGLQIKHFLRLT